MSSGTLQGGDAKTDERQPCDRAGWHLLVVNSGERNVATETIAVDDIAIGVAALGAVSLGVAAMGALVLRETSLAYQGRLGTRMFSAAGTTLASVSSTPGCSPSRSRSTLSVEVTLTARARLWTTLGCARCVPR